MDLLCHYYLKGAIPSRKCSIKATLDRRNYILTEISDFADKELRQRKLEFLVTHTTYKLRLIPRVLFQ